MPQDIYGLPVPIPSMWDWNWALVGLMAGVLIIGLPLLATLSDHSFSRSQFLRNLPRDFFLIAAVTALTIVAQYTTPHEGAWYTTVPWHAALLVLALVAMIRLRGVGVRNGEVLVKGRPNDPELMRTLVYAWILSWVIAAIPAIFTLPLWAIVFSIVLLDAFFAMPCVYHVIVLCADQMTELEERVEHRVEEAWMARRGH